MRVNGQALGIALSAAIVATRLPVHLVIPPGGHPSVLAQNLALADAIHDAFAVAALICCLGIVASLVRGSAAHHPDQAPAGQAAVESGAGPR
jgi:acetyl-CoA carboxylase alpha subunit